ncbi:deoxynucleoside kinase [Alkalihalobacillus trypoxylicola]|uniref:Deoxyguanosine kinase n=1 Tax=Alkalihalobacillus trypoxylicola TaxID=519424 RepID=A0A162CTV1_9BACI|nr:deoxynucleoside kinase [Alkalihalobacillus trypoxylicola]KYG26626.1 deoxyguanosine kinase [Alkalihalobacillus trypoxylicola]GAF64211.1 deoxyguanosine kinase [Bacillus sp. TS-2]
MKPTPFIAVEGPIGVGKTTLTQLISSQFHYHTLHEIVDENPFLSKFYENIEEWSFQTEMFFLCNRYKQLEDIQQLLQKQKPVVADYHILKNLIFARRTLTANQYDKYERIYHILLESLPMPNMMIYLKASVPTLLNRIELRGREMEQNIEPSYLEQLSIDYDHHMNAFQKKYPSIPIIELNSEEADFVRNPAALAEIIEKISYSMNNR